MRIAHALYLTSVAAVVLLARHVDAQDTRTVTLRFRKAGDTVAIRNAQITVDHTIDVVTDAQGIVRIPDLEDGGHIVEVVARGYEGLFDKFASGPGVKMPIDIEVHAVAPPPAPKGQATELRVDGFAARRAKAQGKFFTLAQMKAANGRPLSNFLKVDGGALIVSGPNAESFLASRAQSTAATKCYAAVVRDGLRVYPFDNATPPDLDKIFTDDLASIELYATILPTELRDSAKCGAVVLWSR